MKVEIYMVDSKEKLDSIRPVLNKYGFEESMTRDTYFYRKGKIFNYIDEDNIVFVGTVELDYLVDIFQLSKLLDANPVILDDESILIFNSWM
ncbi:MAG TPA: hypothetical protein DEF85_06025 [Clostridiaceae bacterium]|nr:hypothetical protein [Clostridiaceae bacterium]